MPIEVREVMDAKLVAMAIIRSSWVIRAFSLLGGAAMDGGSDEGVTGTTALEFYRIKTSTLGWFTPK